MIELRSPSAGDVEQVAAIYIDSWNEGFGHLLGLRDHSQERIDRWRDDLASAETTWTIAEHDGHVAGFVGIGPSRDPIDPALGELETIAVAPRCWRQGVGTALMMRGLELLKARWSSAILWTPANYERGHSFYKATGWQELGKVRASGTEVAFGRHL